VAKALGPPVSQMSAPVTAASGPRLIASGKQIADPMLSASTNVGQASARQVTGKESFRLSCGVAYCNRRKPVLLLALKPPGTQTGVRAPGASAKRGIGSDCTDPARFIDLARWAGDARGSPLLFVAKLNDIMDIIDIMTFLCSETVRGILRWVN
jgi:hypothetical protein